MILKKVYMYTFGKLSGSVVVETVSETSHLCWNNETIRFKSSLTSIIIESTYFTLNMNKIWGCFKVQVGWKNAFYGETGSWKGLGETLTIKKNIFLTFTLSVNKIIIYQFSMFKSLDSIASVVGIFMYLTISKFKQVLRSRKGLDYNTAVCKCIFVKNIYKNQVMPNFFHDFVDEKRVKMDSHCSYSGYFTVSFMRNEWQCIRIHSNM